MSPDEQIRSLLPSTEAAVQYFAATERKHFGSQSDPGSTFTDVDNLADLLSLAHFQRGNLDGDSRRSLIASGVHPDAFAAGVRYLLVRTPGTVGILNTSTLHPDDTVTVERTKPNAPCTVVTEVTTQPTAEYGVIIIGPDVDGFTDDGRDVLYTAHPGPPTRPANSAVLDGYEGQQITVRRMREVLGGDVWANTRILARVGE